MLAIGQSATRVASNRFSPRSAPLTPEKIKRLYNGLPAIQEMEFDRIGQALHGVIHEEV